MTTMERVMDKFCTMIESKQLKLGDNVGVFLETLSDNDIQAIIGIAQMLCETIPTSSTSRTDLDNGYFFLEMAFGAISMETKIQPKEVPNYDPPTRMSVADHFSDILCLELARRKMFLELMNPIPASKDFYYNITNTGYKYLDELKMKTSSNFIEKRTKKLLIELDKMRLSHMDRMLNKSIGANIAEELINYIRSK